jgi:flagellar basal-body rod protein FlgG
MMRALYIAKTGMDSSQYQLDTISNNLANSNTVGYKKNHAIFQDLYYQTLRQPGSQQSNGNTLPTGLMVGTGAAPIASTRIFSEGSLVNTGTSLDLAVVGDGFFQVQMPDGTTAYTRDGEFSRNQNGDVVNPEGLPLVPNINIPANAVQLTVSAGGVVQYTLPGATQSPQTAGTIQLATFVNPQGLISLGGNLYAQSGSSGDPQVGDPGTDSRGSIKQGYLEQSNVNVTEELVNMITAQRSFEMNSRSIKAADEMLQTLTQL